MQLVVVGHLHVGVGGIPAVEGTHDTHIVKAVLLGKHQGSGIKAEEVVTLAVALDILGTAAGHQLDRALLSLFGLGFGAPVLGFVVPVVHADQLETAGRASFTEVDETGVRIAALGVIVQVLVHLFEAPGTNGSAGTDDPHVIVEVNVLDNHRVRSKHGRNDIGVQHGGLQGIVLIIGHGTLQLEVHVEGLVGHATQGEDQRVQRSLLHGNMANAVFVDADIG